MNHRCSEIVGLSLIMAGDTFNVRIGFICLLFNNLVIIFGATTISATIVSG